MSRNLREGTEDRCCGACKCFEHECIEGWGICSIDQAVAYCGDVCDNFIDE